MQSDKKVVQERRFSDQVHEYRVGQVSLYTLHMPVEEVVTCKGSFYSFPHFSKGEELLQELTVALLDKGTQKRDKFAIAEWLESRGAEITFHSDGLRISFVCKALRKDISGVISLLAEQLREPRFDPREFELAQAHLAAGIQRTMESTALQASGALSRRLYPPDHPNYVEEPQQAMERLMRYTVEDVKAYHAAHFGANACIIVGVGDIDDLELKQALNASFKDWQPHNSTPDFAEQAVYRAPGRTEIPMPDRVNVDVRMGHGLPLRRTDPDFMPLYLGNYILGGNFSARLMTVVRDEMGLTYGIGSSLVGITPEYEGHWQIGVTLSQDVLEQGIQATLGVVNQFVQEGATEAELIDKKTSIIGSFKVGLATTGGVASALLLALERGFGVEYLDHYPEEVAAVTLTQVNQAIQQYLHPDALHVAIAGLPVKEG